MKRHYLLLFLLCCLGSASLAQRGNNGGQRFARIQSIKAGYITDRIHLTKDQALRFWPLYNQYEADQRGIRQGFRRRYKGAPMGGDSQSKQFIEDDLDVQEQMVTLRRRYKDQFLQVISPQQLVDLTVAEREFKKLLVQQLKNRRQ